jgi:hypothetical protein
LFSENWVARAWKGLDPLVITKRRVRNPLYTPRPSPRALGRATQAMHFDKVNGVEWHLRYDPSHSRQSFFGYELYDPFPSFNGVLTRFGENLQDKKKP